MRTFTSFSRKLLLLLCILFAEYQLEAQAIFIFGGKDHNVYLGNLNTPPSDPNSIWNSDGDYGSRWSSKPRIWDSYSSYGGKYGSYSPFNSMSSYPPALVDAQGNFYGYFISSKYNNKASTLPIVKFILERWEEIAKDPTAAYKIIFGDDYRLSGDAFPSSVPSF